MASPDVLKEYEGRVNKAPDILLAELLVLARIWNKDWIRLKTDPEISVITAQLHSHLTIAATGASPESPTSCSWARFSAVCPLLTRAPSRHSPHSHKDSHLHLPRHRFPRWPPSLSWLSAVTSSPTRAPSVGFSLPLRSDHLGKVLGSP